MSQMIQPTLKYVAQLKNLINPNPQGFLALTFPIHTKLNTHMGLCAQRPLDLVFLRYAKPNAKAYLFGHTVPIPTELNTLLLFNSVWLGKVRAFQLIAE